MANDLESQGNPEIGMQQDSFEAAEAVADTGSETFFDDLENQVNGSIIDDTAEVTQQHLSGSEQVTHNTQNVGSENVDLPVNNGTDWKKRYEDSSREAVRLQERYKQVEPFVPVLQAMKNDSGLVDHVRDYLKNGGKPAESVQEQLGLDEDFVFDANEITDPDSDSAKVMNAHVDKIVQQRVGGMLQREKEIASKKAVENKRLENEAKFRKESGMSDKEYGDMVEWAKTHTLTLDDINFLKNKQKVNANVADATKKDMLNQMKNVRDMPSTVSGANSRTQDRSANDSVFDALMGTDSELDNLFK